jgi:hypothetical protein
MLGTLTKAKAEKKSITVMSPKREEASEELHEMHKADPGLNFHHTYALVDVAEDKRELKLFNPWGQLHPNGSGWIKIDDFKRFFLCVNISG